jgi:hypothetical protein
MFYTLDCPYYYGVFESLDALITDVIKTGMDPNYEVMINGNRSGNMLVDLIIQ